jgi:hypothetical protein
MNIQQLENANYKRFEIPSGSKEFNKLADFLMQKSIRDEIGKRYFITVYCYDRSRYPYPHNREGGYAFMPTAQLHLDREAGTFINVEIGSNEQMTVDQMELHIDTIWQSIGANYYDKWVLE